MKKLLVAFTLFMSINSFAQDAQQALIEAVQTKNLDAVKKVVEQLNADVNKPWDNKAIGKPYALHEACNVFGPSIEIVKYLVEKGAKMDVEDKFGRTPLMSLVMKPDSTNRLEICKLFIEKGADVNAISSGGGSVLGYACEGSNLECIKLLIEKGADVNGRKNNLANTPLMYAVSVFGGQVNNGSETIIDLLLASGADPKEERKVAQRDGSFAIKTAADIAKEKGHGALADKLASAKKVKVSKK